MAVVDVSELGKRYGEVVAVDDVSFSVTEGEIFGILGPNGLARQPPLSVSRACASRTPGP